MLLKWAYVSALWFFVSSLNDLYYDSKYGHNILYKFHILYNAFFIVFDPHDKSISKSFAN